MNVSVDSAAIPSRWRARTAGGPYRFPVQAGYFDPARGKEDARRLAALPLAVTCAAHAVPKLDGCRTLLQELAKD